MMEILFVKICLFLWSFSAIDASFRVRRGFCSTRNLAIENGDYALRSGNSIVKYSCNRGFQIYGSETLVCFGQTWNTDPPLCIANTCPKISQTSVMRIQEEYSGALLKFSCAALYKLEGSSKLLCTGKDWTNKEPTCQPWDPPLSCDLESSDLCGWYHDEKGDQEWRWNTGSTPTSRTGPSHDHTLGEGGDGHYMYFETSSPTRPDHQAMLNSPLYPANYSQGRCFSFWYHIHGSGDIGDLQLFFRPEGADIKALTPVFHVNEDGGDIWYSASVHVTPQDTAFQIVFVAIRATSYRSDYAIDDFKLGDCTDTMSPISNTTKAAVTTPTTLKPTTVTKQTTFAVTSRQSTTKTTVKTTQRPTTIPTKTTTMRQTTIKTTQPTTMAPRTTKRTHAPTTPQPTTKAPVTTKRTHDPTTPPPTTKAPVTTKRTTVASKQTQKPAETKQTSKLLPEYTTVTSSDATLKPIVNPHISEKSKVRIPESRDNTTEIIYIVIGIGLVAVIVGGAVLGIICYRRSVKKRNLQRSSLSSTNPLYKIMAGDEAAVHFAVDPDEND